MSFTPSTAYPASFWTYMAQCMVFAIDDMVKSRKIFGARMQQAVYDHSKKFFLLANDARNFNYAYPANTKAHSTLFQFLAKKAQFKNAKSAEPIDNMIKALHDFLLTFEDERGISDEELKLLVLLKQVFLHLAHEGQLCATRERMGDGICCGM